MGERTTGRAAIGLLVVGVIAAASLVAVIFMGGQVSRRLGGVPRSYYSAGTSWDIACSTTAPDGNPAGCSTPLPSLEPSAIAAAVPLRIAALDVPITSVGPEHIDLGEAVIPNGVLTDVEFRLEGIAPGVQQLPTGLEIADMVRLVVRSTDPTRPGFSNGYVHGWYPGVERVKAALEFDVTHVDLGFVLHIRDVVVR